MTLYYFRVEEGDEDTSVHIAANKEKLEKSRKALMEEFGNLGSVTVGEISKRDDDWAVFSSVSPITLDQMDRGGQDLYAYTVHHDSKHDGEATIATNKEDIQALHHDDMIPASEDEKQNLQVENIQRMGSEVIIHSLSFIE